MTATDLPLTARIDAALDEVHRERQRARLEPPSVRRASRMADLFEQEALLWSALFEHTRTRVYWRAALAAEIYARQLASLWRQRAAGQMLRVPSRACLIDGCFERDAEHGTPARDGSGGVR